MIPDSRCPPRPPSLTALLLSLVVLVLTTTPVGAQTEPVLTWRGEIRPRVEARDPVHGEWDHWISMRSRLALDARFQGGMGLFVQIQDVRDWGEETSNRDKSADAVDFHQAYLEVDGLPGIGGMIRAGRQEVNVAEGRFLAAPNWGQAGQTFDGARWVRSLGQARLEMVYLRLQEGSSDTHQVSADLTSAWIALPVGRLGSLDLLLIHDRSGDPDGTGPLAESSQTTTGTVWKKSAGPLALRLQAMIQAGRRLGTDVSASMIAGSGKLTVLDGDGSVTLWYDRLSGDDDPGDGELGAFSTLYGARHRFYGRADYFTDIPANTANLGLSDGALKISYAPHPLLSMNLDLHTFHTTRLGPLSSRHLGEEVDAWVQYRFRGALSLEAGTSFTWGGRAMEELGLLEGRGTLGYLMTSLDF